ncbi:hypothetical protein PISL3812_06010 [Talaromyces islandicus]|uniref:phosphatidylinositol-3,4,5-trisphosphate 3-phosphatase n=1 Tax=Talaromyces islandicus TaxID=28573 RepID=A0A0U1M096_TALIS|nr:hypothetical protein PISL3812_06010 [Talaromyces islandicus]
MLPLGLLTAAQGHPMLVELKNGETLNGHLVNCDNWMNLTLKEVVQTSPEGDRFYRLPEVYVRGNNIKYLRVPEEIIDIVKEQQQHNQGSHRGGRGGRGDGRDRGRGGRGGRGRGRGRGVRQKAARRCLSSESATSDVVFKRLKLTHSTTNQNNDTIANSPNESDGYDGWSAPRSSRHRWQTPEPTLQERLEEQSSQRRTEIPKIACVLREIFRNRHVSPNSQHYKALILANIDRKRGSSKHVHELLSEMEAKEITADSATLHAALETLAVHPDYLLRQEIIAALRTRWLSLSPAGWHHLTAGLIRDGQLELALNRIELMEIQGIRLEQWLHSLLIYSLCAEEEFDEVVRLMRRRGMKISNISKKLWIYLLDKAIQASHLNLASYIWKNTVEMSYADVNAAHCRQILDLASRDGDTQLAESAFRQIAVLEEPLCQEDYEQLARGYAKIGDFDVASELLFLLSLQETITHPALVWRSIVELRQKKLDIPVGLANMVIEYCGAALASDSFFEYEAVEVALNIYKDIPDICSGDANTHTFNLLFALCRHQNRPDVFTFLAREMIALNIEPDQTTLEHLILASLLRQIVAGPRLQHPETGLDLCYVTDFLIVTSGPSSTYPRRAYRNPTDALVRFLDKNHGENWAIWEFRAEGTGYPDSEVYGRIHHFPFPDHHPPPFTLIPAIMASMRNWLKEGASDIQNPHQPHDSTSPTSASKDKRKVAVVHCKAGKGRSGTVSCSYLISQEGWTMEDALKRFTERRMRAGFGEGVSIPSQLRWIGYVNRWTNTMNKTYVERPVEILEVHVWGLRDGVKIAVEGYVNEGRKIKCFHLFKRRERIVVDEGNSNSDSNSPLGRAGPGKETLRKKVTSASSLSSLSISQPARATETVTSPQSSGIVKEDTMQLSAAILRPDKPVILPTSDVNIDFERRTKAAYTGWAMVTSIAHVWFNAFFEGGDEHDSGIFECEWDKLDGIKGTSRKGIRALERVKVVWRYPSKTQLDGEVEKPEPQDIHEIPGQVMTLPKPGEPVHESHAADWRGDNVVRESRDEQECFGNYDVDSPSTSPLSRGESKKQDDAVRQIIGQDIVPDEPKEVKGANHSLATEASVAAASAVTSAVGKFSQLGRERGLRQQTDTSKDVSLASSVEDLSQSQKAAKRETESSSLQKQGPNEGEDDNSEMEGVKAFYENGNGNGEGESKG